MCVVHVVKTTDTYQHGGNKIKHDDFGVYIIFMSNMLTEQSRTVTHRILLKKYNQKEDNGNSSVKERHMYKQLNERK